MIKRDWKITTGKDVKYQPEMVRLANAIMLQSSLSIIQVSAPHKGNSFEDRGNNAADAAAKQTAG